MRWKAAGWGTGLGMAALWGLALWPVLRAGYPGIGDGLNHFYRLVEFEHLLANGAWFPRWAADLGYGFGYPLFNYYPPLTYYLGSLFHVLGMNEAHSLLAVYGLAWALALGGAYLLAGQAGRPAAALTAAAAYGLAPYLYFNALARGALPEVLGLGLLPWVLWTSYRLVAQPGRAILAAAALAYAALVLTHLLTALLALPLMGLFWLMALRQNRPARAAPSHFLKAGATLLLGFGLTAYFLLPALLETGSVHLSQLTGPGDLDFHNNFLSLGTLLAWPRTFDARLVFQAVPPSLSLAALTLAGLGLAVAAWRGRRDGQGLTTWDAGLWLGLFALGALSLPWARPIWEAVPGMSLIQFPWRLVGPASLLLALLAGRGVEALLEATRKTDAAPQSEKGWTGRAWIGPPALAALFLYSLTWTFSAGAPAPLAAGVRDLAEYERSSGELGTTSAGEFLPASVETLPDPHGLDAAYAKRDVIERLGTLPPGVTLESQTATLTSAEAVVSAPAAATLTFDFYYFPGWLATVDGLPAAITPSTPHGLITLPLPAGRHTIRVSLGSTPPRTLGTVISLSSVTLLALLAFVRVPGHPRNPAPLATPTPNAGEVPATHRRPVPFRPHTEGRCRSGHTLALTALVILIARALLIDGRATVFANSRFDGERVTGAGQILDFNFDDQLVLIGLDAPGLAMSADGELPVTLYWRAQNAPRADYSTTLQVLDQDGNIWGQSDSQNPGRQPTTRWTPEQYARDEHLLRLLPGTPPGRYRLAAGVYVVGGAALSWLDAGRAPKGQVADLGTLTVTRARWPVAALHPGATADLPLGPLTWLGYSLNTASPQAGDEIKLAWFWRAEGGTRADLGLHLMLRSAGGTVIQTWDAPLAESDYPTSAWTEGEVVRGVTRLRVPAAAPAGPAQLEFSLRPAAGGDDVAGPVQAAALNLRVPVRTFDAPSIAHSLGAGLGALVRLLGYDLEPGSGQLTLYWQALQPMDISYQVFVHALGADGTITAQADAAPVGGSRPTTSWLPGEVLADRYALPFGAATALEVGMYDPRTGQRLGLVRIALQ